MIARVPQATVVIANPTHYAIALRYVRTENRAPLVVAKGLDHIALNIRAMAEKHGIPVVEDKLLARSLYDKVEVDQLIPPEFYRAVANVILYIMSRGRPLQGIAPNR
jgi:flagellar biosynthetic protein FlhB